VAYGIFKTASYRETGWTGLAAREDSPTKCRNASSGYATMHSPKMFHVKHFVTIRDQGRTASKQSDLAPPSG
jgi:hypothetical protein